MYTVLSNLHLVESYLGASVPEGRSHVHHWGMETSHSHPVDMQI